MSMFKQLKKTIGLGALVATCTLAVGAYAFTASNTVPDTKAGSGSGAISGYTVSNIEYENTENNVTGVTFNLTAAARLVNVKLVTSGGTWYDCGASVGTEAPFAVSCDVNVPAATADSLTVSASQ